MDVDICTETAATHSITAMPTFMFLRGGEVLEKLEGADNASLEAKVSMQHTGVILLNR